MAVFNIESVLSNDIEALKRMVHKGDFGEAAEKIVGRLS
jgi:hypothetical protein